MKVVAFPMWDEILGLEGPPMPAAFELVWWRKVGSPIAPALFASTHRFCVVIYAYDTTDGDRWVWRAFIRQGNVWGSFVARAGFLSGKQAKRHINRVFYSAAARTMRYDDREASR